MNVRIAPAAILFALASLAGCGAGCGSESKEKPPVEVLIKVESDPGKPIKGANILFNGKPIATTDDTGSARLTLNGNEGDTYDVNVKCPPGHQSPTKSLSIPLRRLTDPSKTPEYELACPPMTRTIVIAVRAENGANLPIMHLGREVARTDTSGAATVLLENLDADSQFELKLDTTEKGNEQLRPQNPASVYTIKRSDDVFTFDQKFIVEKKATVWHPTVKKVGPVALPTKVTNF
jgi:hypothetical protein